ncbi:CHAT domain-containing protein [Kitasatospora sp. NPDC088548]|uniref:CHAT domain-containing protein n=1 Tax=Kitasatospora sp. NPDC088548 TaxID=3364075 RepID=UPI0038075F5D
MTAGGGGPLDQDGPAEHDGLVEQDGLVGLVLEARALRARYGEVADEPPGRRREFLDAAARRHEEALPHARPGGPEAAELHEGLGLLHFERYAAGGGAPDAERSVRHLRAALDAAPEDSDLPLLRFELARSLMAHGQEGAGREPLEEALALLGRAVDDSGDGPAGPPRWRRDAVARRIVIRTVLLWSWQDDGQIGPAMGELEPLLAEPGALDELPPPFVGVFGRLVHEQAARRADPAGRDRGIGLVQLAVERWRPQWHGPVAGEAVLLAMLQKTRYDEDRDPGRLTAVLDGTTRALAAEHLDPALRPVIRALDGWTRQELAERVPGSVEPPAALDQDLGEAFRELLGIVEAGETFVGFTDAGANATLRGIGGRDRLRAEFERLFAQWRTMDPADARYAPFARQLLELIPVFQPLGVDVPPERAVALFRAAAAAERDPAALGVLHLRYGHVRLLAGLAGDTAALADAVEHLDTAAGLIPETDSGHWEALATLRAMALAQRGQVTSGVDDLEAAMAALARQRELPDTTPYLRRLLDAQLAGLETLQAARREDLPTAERAVARLAELYAALEEGDPARGEVWTQLEGARVARDHVARALGVPPRAEPGLGPPTLAELRGLAARLPRGQQAWVLGDGGLTRVRHARDYDPKLLDEAAELLREAIGLTDEGTDDWLRYTGALGSTLCTRAAGRGDRAGLDEGIALLERAAELAGGPEHRLWPVVGSTLGRAYRTRADPAADDRRRGRRCGLDAVRGYSWLALLQSGTRQAAEATGLATDIALEVAAWCLADDAPEDAVAALDSCRGLVLHAATTSRSVPELLDAAGLPDLAGEWLAAAGGPGGAADGVPSELRRRVLTGLTGADHGRTPARLLATPTPAEIGAALVTLRADALVYLVPASDDHPGAAVLVTADGAAHWLPLPLLREDAAALRAYRPAGPAARDLGPAPSAGAPSGPPPLRRRLDRLCSWAWYAALRPLLDLLVPPAGRSRPPSLVLVPMGGLDVVPWHAAWSEPETAGRRRYALERAEISYAASARLFCDVAARPAVPHDGSALIVGDPTGDLWYAGEEAAAVQRVFYPRGAFHGRRAGAGTAGVDGPGTPAEVLGWLRSGAGAGGVLHLACHATVAANQHHSSYLLLSGGELAAEELTGAAGRPAGGLELVVLAACRSHVSGRGRNEAYSLATAFLVAGARSVVGSLWPVPDEATSVLMFMTHHFLRVEAEPPGRALRRAQLWMLDPHRRPPPGMPAELAARSAAVEPDDLSAWAGFTHLGR